MKQNLTLHQRLSYAHWSTKFVFDFPCVGWFMALMVFFFWLGIVLWFFEPELASLMKYSGEHASGKMYFARIIFGLVLFAVSYVTVYVVFFIQNLVDIDDDDLKHFLKYHYRKH